jgi:RHS repeat-associated protein
MRLVYDGDGGRVKQTTAAGTTRYLGEAYEVGPTLSTKYVFAGSQRIAAKDSTGALRFYHPDHLGSSNVVTDATGALVELNEHTPYGSLSRHEGTANVPQKFTGQRLDASTNLYFYHARYYDPQLGRFIQADPLVPAPGDPQALNRYSYVRNNPLKYVDPSGHGWFSKFFSSVLQAVGILLAPFTAGQSLWLTAAGTAWSGVQAAQAGQFGAWAAGFAVSLALGAIIPIPNSSNFFVQAGLGAVKGAAIGAIAGGVGSLVAGGAFGEGAAFGALGGAAGGAIAGIATSQQYQNWANKEGFLSNWEVRANHYRRDNAKLRALSVKDTDRVNLTAGARDIEGPIKAGHGYTAAPNGNRFEMGPLKPGRSIVTSNTTDVSTWDTSVTTQNAITAGLARETSVSVSRNFFPDSMALYEAYWVGQPYEPCCWSSFNSNFANNSVIYGAGGPEKVTGVGIAPGFPDN